jgi:hypothetical protein
LAVAARPGKLRGVLTCDDCAAETEVDERGPGWRASIVPGPGPDEPRRVVVYCPDCAAIDCRSSDDA